MILKVWSWLVDVDSVFSKIIAILGKMPERIQQSKGTSKRSYINICISSESLSC